MMAAAPAPSSLATKTPPANKKQLLIQTAETLNSWQRAAATSSPPRRAASTGSSCLIAGTSVVKQAGFTPALWAATTPSASR